MTLGLAPLLEHGPVYYYTVADMANPFALETKKPAYTPKTYTDEDKTKLLEGFDEVHPDMWMAITEGASVRYVNQIGKFCAGGKVVRIWAKKNDAKLRYMQLENTSGSRYIIGFDKLAKVYAKSGAGVLKVEQQLRAVVEGVNQRNRILTGRLKSLEDRVSALDGKKRNTSKRSV